MDFHPLPKIRINESFRLLIPALSKDERTLLEANLIVDGCRDPLSLWGDVLIDGHNRYEICTRRGLTFETRQIEGLESEDDARLWICRNQLGRRNLTDYQRVVLALVAKPLIEAEAKARQEAGINQHSLRENSHEGSPIRTDETVGAMADVSSNSVRKVEVVEQRGIQEVREAASRGDISINLAHQVAKLPAADQHVAFEAMTDEDVVADRLREVVALSKAPKIPLALLHTGDEESYTPSEYIESARLVMGSIDTDPASNTKAQKTVNAQTFYTIADDGLSKSWAGKVWMNPPYTALVINKFLDKLVTHYLSGEVTAAIVLTNNNTDTSWFHATAGVAAAICFTAGRINFIKPDGSKSSPTNGQLFFYLGNDVEAFKAEFSKHGLVMVAA
jgi:hypothetical protein